MIPDKIYWDWQILTFRAEMPDGVIHGVYTGEYEHPQDMPVDITQEQIDELLAAREAHENASL